MLIATATATSSLSAEQRIQKATAAIMRHPAYIAMAGVLMIGEKTVRDDVPTACTNGRDEYYGRAFVDQTNDAELRFLILHENFHKMLRDLDLWDYLYREDAQLAGLACDYIINGKLIRAHAEDKFATMTGPLAVGCYDPKYDDAWDVLRVYNDLKQKRDEQGGGQGDEQGQGQSQGQGQGQGQGEQSFDEHDWEGAKELSADEKEALAKQIDEALRQGALVAGKAGGSVNRDIEELLRPQVNWRDALREFMTTTCKGNDFGTWAKPNRRFVGAGIYMPSPISEKVEELVIAVDTSGSIGGKELTTFLSEVTGICDSVNPSRVRLLYWDSRVAGDESYEEHNLQTLAHSTKPVGGGGTDVNCVTAYMKEHNITPQAVVVLTDGYLFGGWGQWPCPVLWCILNNRKAKPDSGQVVHVKSFRAC